MCRNKEDKHIVISIDEMFDEIYTYTDTELKNFLKQTDYPEKEKILQQYGMVRCDDIVFHTVEDLKAWYATWFTEKRAKEWEYIDQ